MFVWWAFKPRVFAFCPKLMKTEGICLSEKEKQCVFCFSLRETRCSGVGSGDWGSIPRDGNTLWKILCPQNIHVFLWLCLYNKILTRDNVAKRKKVDDLTCLQPHIREAHHSTVSSPDPGQACPIEMHVFTYASEANTTRPEALCQPIGYTRYIVISEGNVRRFPHHRPWSGSNRVGSNDTLLYYYISLFMVIVYYPCCNCIDWKHSACVDT
ncbi:hypothetical protein ZWY2020_046370 [Hordeum vulgare]|nr:hypothetical protein ZWY2020_046370 [Hordeum vulgare]